MSKLIRYFYIFVIITLGTFELISSAIYQNVNDICMYYGITFTAFLAWIGGTLITIALVEILSLIGMPSTNTIICYLSAVEFFWLVIGSIMFWKYCDSNVGSDSLNKIMWISLLSGYALRILSIVVLYNDDREREEYQRVNAV